MGLHRAFVAYAMCDGPRDGHGRVCPAFVAPGRIRDPQSAGAVLVDNVAVFTLAAELGWQVPQRVGELWLCPGHKPGREASRG